MEPITGKDMQAGAWLKGIYAITLFVEDVEAAKEFYRKVFGLPVVFEDENSCVFRFGNTLVNLLKISEAKELIEPREWRAAKPERAWCSRSTWRMWTRCARN